MSVLSENRRAFLGRNGRAIAMIAASALAGLASTPAQARKHHCFLKSTAIRTADGWRAVEDLTVGDLVPTQFSGLQPIRWVGRYVVSGRDGEGLLGSNAPAVRIRASALADGVPRADLVVTAGHSLFVDGLLFPAGSLVNGETITTVDAQDGVSLEFFHVKLDRHDVIDAEGALTETMGAMTRDDPNFEAYARMYGVTEDEIRSCCAPVAFNGGRSELVSRLRSVASPWIDRRRPADVIRDRLETRAWRLSA